MADTELSIVLRAVDKATAEIKQAVGELKNLEGAATKASSSASKLSDDLQRLGKITMGATAAGVAAIGAALGGSVKAAIDFESSFAGVRKTVNASEAEFGQLRQGLRDMAKEIPTSVNGLANIAAAAGQLGIKKENILDFTKTVADLGVATNLVGEEAAMTLAKIANVMQMPQEQFRNMGSSIVALGNNFATTERDIAAMAQRLSAAGKVVGMSTADVLGLATALSSVGIEAESGGTAMSRVMSDIAASVSEGGDKLAGFAQVAGLSVAKFKELFARDSASAIVAFVSGLGAIQRAGGDVFGTLEALELGDIRTRNALLSAANAGDLMARALQMSNSAWRENTALTKEAEARYATTASQLQLLRNHINDLMISLGETFLPAIVAIAGRLAEFFDGLAAKVREIRTEFTAGGTRGVLTEALGLSEDTTNRIMTAIALLQQLADLLSNGVRAGLDFLTENSDARTAALGALAGVFGLLAAATALWVASLIVAAAPIIAVAVAAAAIGAALALLIVHFDDIRAAVDEFSGAVADRMVSAFEGLTGGVEDGIAAITDLGSSLYSAGVDLVENLASGIASGIDAVVDWFTGLPDEILSAIGDTSEILYDAGSDLISGFLEGMLDKAEEPFEWLASLPGKAKEIIQDAADGHSPWGIMIPTGADLVAGIQQGVVEGSASLIGAVHSVVVSAGVTARAEASAQGAAAGRAFSEEFIASLRALPREGTSSSGIPGRPYPALPRSDPAQLIDDASQYAGPFIGWTQEELKAQQDIARRAGLATAKAAREGFATGLSGGGGGGGKAERTALDEFLSGMADYARVSPGMKQLNDAGQKVMDAVVEGVRTNAGSAGKKAADALQKIWDDAKKAGVKGVDDLGRAVLTAMQRAFTDRTPEAVAAVEEALQALVRAVDGTAVEGFDRAMANLAKYGTVVDEYEKLGRSTVAAIVKGIEDGTRDAGEGAVQAVADLIKRAKEDGVAEAESMGDDIMTALRAALEAGTPEALAAVDALVGQMVTRMQEAGELTGQSFKDALTGAFARQDIEDAVGGAGMRLLDALNKAITEGGAKNIQSLATLGAQMAGALRGKLPPDMAKAIIVPFLAALNEAVDTKSPESIEKLRAWLATINVLMTGGAVNLQTGAVLAAEAVNSLARSLGISKDEIIAHFSDITRLGLDQFVTELSKLPKETQQQIGDVVNQVIGGQLSIEQAINIMLDKLPPQLARIVQAWKDHGIALGTLFGGINDDTRKKLEQFRDQIGYVLDPATETTRKKMEEIVSILRSVADAKSLPEHTRIAVKALIDEITNALETGKPLATGKMKEIFDQLVNIARVGGGDAATVAADTASKILLGTLGIGDAATTTSAGGTTASTGPATGGTAVTGDGTDFIRMLGDLKKALIEVKEEHGAYAARVEKISAAYREVADHSIPGMIAGLESLMERLQAPEWGESASHIGPAMLNAIAAAVSQSTTEREAILTALRSAITGVVLVAMSTASSGGVAIGAALMAGLSAGIEGGTPGTAKSAADAVKTVLDAMKEAAGIKSPSQLFRKEVGHPIAEGVAAGIRDGIPEIVGVLTSVADWANAFGFKLTPQPTTPSAADYPRLGGRVAPTGPGVAYGKRETVYDPMDPSHTAGTLLPYYGPGGPLAWSPLLPPDLAKASGKDTPAPPIVINVTAIDAPSFETWLRTNGSLLVTAITDEVARSL